jgi:synaptobrevin family protein YKT6
VLHICALREGICAVSITDSDYPDRVAKALCRKIANEFTSKYPRTAYASAKVGDPQLSYPELKTYLEKYQNPEEADNIAKITKELDETKEVMRQTIESMLERGEKIDNLVAKSDGLSAQSKMFYTQVCLCQSLVAAQRILTGRKGQETEFLLQCHVNMNLV